LWGFQALFLDGGADGFFADIKTGADYRADIGNA
jgi:hypothetical protein